MVIASKIVALLSNRKDTIVDSGGLTVWAAIKVHETMQFNLLMWLHFYIIFGDITISTILLCLVPILIRIHV